MAIAVSGLHSLDRYATQPTGSGDSDMRENGMTLYTACYCCWEWGSGCLFALVWAGDRSGLEMGWKIGLGCGHEVVRERNV